MIDVVVIVNVVVNDDRIEIYLLMCACAIVMVDVYDVVVADVVVMMVVGVGVVGGLGGMSMCVLKLCVMSVPRLG